MLSILNWSKDPSWRREEKEEKGHRRMNRWYHRCKSQCTWYTAQKQTKWRCHRRMIRRSSFYMCRMNCRAVAAKSVAPDDPMVWVRIPSIHHTLSLNQDRDAPRRSLKHWMNRRHSQRKRWSIRRSRRNQQNCFGDKSFNTEWSDAPSVYSVKQLCQQICNS
jgi:hypothetical protein